MMIGVSMVATMIDGVGVATIAATMIAEVAMMIGGAGMMTTGVVAMMIAAVAWMIAEEALIGGVAATTSVEVDMMAAVVEEGMTIAVGAMMTVGAAGAMTTVEGVAAAMTTVEVATMTVVGAVGTTMAAAEMLMIAAITVLVATVVGTAAEGPEALEATRQTVTVAAPRSGMMAAAAAGLPLAGLRLPLVTDVIGLVHQHQMAAAVRRQGEGIRTVVGMNPCRSGRTPWIHPLSVLRMEASSCLGIAGLSVQPCMHGHVAAAGVHRPAGAPCGRA